MLPKIKSTELLYRMNRDGASCEIFHERCDDKGATLVLVSTNDGHIFGGYNPTSWLNSFSYSDCEDAFLISFRDSTGKRKPFKCPVKNGKSEFAIKQNEIKFSPGFGEANNCDLFISFKNPSKSYSRLGTVYQLPIEYARLG